MNTLTREQHYKILEDVGLSGCDIDALNAAFALGIAQGEANRTAVYEKAERLEQMLLDKPSILASSTAIRARK
jgi:hypothetical protein